MSSFLFESVAPHVTATAIVGISLALGLGWLHATSSSPVAKSPTTTFGWIQHCREWLSSSSSDDDVTPHTHAPPNEEIYPEQELQVVPTVASLMQQFEVTNNVVSNIESRVINCDRRIINVENRVTGVETEVADIRREIGVGRVMFSMAEKARKVLHNDVKDLEKKVEKLEKKDEEQDMCFYIICATIVAILCCVAKYDIF